MGSNTTVLVYYDLKDCVSCKIKELNFWNDFLCAFNGIVNNNETNKIVFVINVKPDEQLSELFATLHEECIFSIVYDLNEEFKRMIPLPEESPYQCFLLDDKHRVILIGKPIFNSSLFDKYLSIISES